MQRNACPKPQTRLRPASFYRTVPPVLVAAVWAVLAPLAFAQGLPSSDGVDLNQSVPREVEDVTVEQRLGEEIPKQLELVDAAGSERLSGELFDGNRPVIVTLNYSSCPMLCSVQLNALVKSLNEVPLVLGEDFRVLTVSIDPTESTEKIRQTKQSYIGQLPDQPKAAEGWTFCTADQPAIDRLTKALGFQYTYDEGSGEYYHPAMLAFASPDGVITRYSLGVQFPPDQLKLALVDAGEGNVGGPVDQFILWCYSYDPDGNSYVPHAWRIMRLGGGLTVVLMLAALLPYWIGRRRSPRRDVSAGLGRETPGNDFGGAAGEAR